MKNIIATIFSGLMLLQSALAFACVPMETQPLNAEQVKGYLNDADVAFIGTLTVKEILRCAQDDKGKNTLRSLSASVLRFTGFVF